MRALWLVVAAGCAQPVVALQLEMPPSVPADFDVSCIGAVDVMGFSQAMLDQTPPDIGFASTIAGAEVSCANISHATTLAELTTQMHGQIDVPLPAGGLASLELRARIGTCGGIPFGEAMVYGGGAYTAGASTLAVGLVANISCKATTTFKVQPVDVLALTIDPAHACTTLVAGDDSGVLPAVIRPTHLSTATSGPTVMMFEQGGVGQPLGTDGTATVSSFTATATTACVAIAYENNALLGSSCVNRGQPTLCATDPNTVELPVATYTKVESPDIHDDALVAQYGYPVLGFVWEKTTTGKAPLAGATVTAKDPTRAKVVYLDLVNGNLVKTTGAATTAAGVYLVYSNGISALTIAAAAHASQRILAGGGAGFDATALAVLAPQ